MSQPHVESQPLRRVVIDHAESELGRRLVATLADDPGAEVVAADRVIEEYASGPDPSTGAIDVILLAPGHGPEIDGSTLGGVDVASVRLLVRRLEAVGARANSVVVVSSAMVYGAEPDNPLPLTEDAPRRPAPDSPFAEAKVALENEAVRSGQVLGGAPVAVLRPCLVVAPTQAAVNWLSRSLWHAPTARLGSVDPPRQYLHIDDLVRAIDHARRHRLDGAFNVAPSDWISSSRQLELAGRPAAVRVPDPVAHRVAEIGWRFLVTSTPPDIVAYAMRAWVVSSDRLRATGWEPRFESAEVFVIGHHESWWSKLSARRRQDLSLVGLAVLAAAASGGAGSVVRHAVRGRQVGAPGR